MSAAPTHEAVPAAVAPAHAPAPAAAAMPPPVAMPPPAVGGVQPQVQSANQQVVYYVYQMQAPAANASSQGLDWGQCFTFYFLRTALNFLNIACWVILLAGTCKAQSNCNSGYFNNANNYPFPGVGFYPSVSDLTKGDCGTIYGLLWWSVWLQFSAVFVATITSISMFLKSKTIRSIFTTTMYFFIMSSVLLFFIADEYNTQTWVLNKKVDNNSNNWTQWIAATTLITVGAVSSLICNFLWIVWNSYGDIPEQASLPKGAPAPAHGPHGPSADGDAFVGPAETKPAVHQVHPTNAPTVTVAQV